MEISVWQLFIIFGFPTAVTAFGLWGIQRTIVKNEEKNKTRDKTREKHQVLIIRGVNASLSLGEATACAIRDGQCNGDVTKALKNAQETMLEQKMFLEEQAVNNILN